MCYVEEAIQETPEDVRMAEGLRTLTAEVEELQRMSARVEGLQEQVGELQNELVATRVEMTRTEPRATETFPQVIYSNHRTKKVHKVMGLAGRPAHTWSTTCGWEWAAAVKVCRLEKKQPLPAKAVLCRDCASALKLLAMEEPDSWPSEFMGGDGPP